MDPPVVRLHLFFARDNDRAVILRQGPTRMFRMILWHRDGDRFEDGQFLRQKIYVERCDLSPDGRHFLYFTLGGDWSGRSEGAYTVLSRPPWFTALSLFPEGSTWGGGGRFLTNRDFVADGGADVVGREHGLRRLSRRAGDAGCPTGLRDDQGRCVELPEQVAARAFERAPREVPELARYDTQGGRLCRRSGGGMELIRDLTEMPFEPVVAPYDDAGERPMR